MQNKNEIKCQNNQIMKLNAGMILFFFWFLLINAFLFIILHMKTKRCLSSHY
jgi:hypothetical protein